MEKGGGHVKFPSVWSKCALDRSQTETPYITFGWGQRGPGCLQLTSSFILLYVAVIHPSFFLFLFERLSTSASTLKITYSSSSLHFWSASLNSQTRNLIFWHVYKHHVTHVIAHIALNCCSTSRESYFQRNVFIFTNLLRQKLYVSVFILDLKTLPVKIFIGTYNNIINIKGCLLISTINKCD